MKRLISLSVIDQALLSAVSLAISLVLIKYATPQSVGSFAVASAMTFLAMGVQNALVITPAALRTYGIALEERGAILATLSSIDLLLNAGLTFVCLLAGLAMGFSLVQAVAAALFLCSSLIRELARGLLIADGDVNRCILLDATFVAAGAAGVIALWRSVSPDIACMMGLAAGNLLSSWMLAPAFHRQPRLLKFHMATYPSYWTETRWMLVGAGATEFHERSYVFLLQILRGLTTVGTIHAGRFLISPLGLLTTAWGRATRPRMAALLRDGNHAEARKIVHSGLIAMFALTFAYFAALLAFWNVIERLLFDGRYENMWPVVVAWCGYGLLSVPANCMSFYFQAERRFMPLAMLAVASSIGSLLFMLSLTYPVPDLTAILCLCAGAAIALVVQLKWWLTTPASNGRPQ